LRKLKTSLIASTILAALSAAPSLLAQDNQATDYLFSMSFEDLLDVEITTATKVAQSSLTSPSVVTILSARDIKMYGYQDLAEILSHVAGFVDNNDLAMHNFGVRGINAGARAGSRSIKVMIDNQPIAFRATSQNFIGLELLPIEMIDRVEIVRGPVSTLYGANAFLGVVNVITHSAEYFDDNGSHLKLNINKLSNAGEGYHAAFSTGEQNNQWGYRVGVSSGSSDRAGIELPQSSPYINVFQDISSDEDKSKPKSFYFRADYQTDENQQWHISSHYQELDVDNVFSDLNPLLETANNHIGLSNGFIRLGYETQWTKNVGLTFYTAYSKGEPLSSDRIETGAPDFFLNRRFGYNATEYGVELLWSFNQTDHLLFGLDASYEDYDIETFSRIERDDGAISELNSPLSKEVDNTGLYAQWLFNINQQWSGIGGFRLDDSSQYSQQSSYRVGLVGDLSFGILKLLYGTSFQAPSSELLFRSSVQPDDIIGNPTLEPQKADTLEINFSNKLTTSMHFVATLYLTQVSDLVVFQRNFLNLEAENSTDSESNGLEVEIRFKKGRFDAYFNGIYQKNRRDIDPLTLYLFEQNSEGELFPGQAFNFGLSYFWPDPKLRLSLDNSYVGKRHASTINVARRQAFYTIPDYIDSTLSISTQAFSLLENKSSEIRFQIRDLFNEKYSPGFGGIDFPSEGRRFSLSFIQQF